MGFGSWRCALLVSCALAAACGKKGPPLAPFVETPAAVEMAGARRIGDDVYLTMRVPARNIDESSPASIQRIDVYGVTATAAPPRGAPFIALATRVATIPVARAAEPGDDSGAFVSDPATGALQGDSVTIRESLSTETMIAVQSAVGPGPTGDPPLRDLTTTAEASMVERFYMAIAFSRRDRPGPPSEIVSVPLAPAPPPVAAVEVSMTGASVQVHWEPSGGLVGWLLARPLPPEIPPVQVPPEQETAAPAPPAGPIAYNVYRRVAPDPLKPQAEVHQSPWTAVAPEPLNATPLTSLNFEDPVSFDGRERCYHIRAIRGSGAAMVESGPSGSECVAAVDTEPPAAPSGLAADVAEGAITLYWDPNSDPDLGGYVVLRREPGDATLLPLTTTRETQYVDRGIVPGRTYIYVVRAIDRRLPLPNTSAPVEVTETAR